MPLNSLLLLRLFVHFLVMEPIQLVVLVSREVVRPIRIEILVASFLLLRVDLSVGQLAALIFLDLAFLLSLDF